VVFAHAGFIFFRSDATARPQATLPYGFDALLPQIDAVAASSPALPFAMPRISQDQRSLDLLVCFPHRLFLLRSFDARA
jgi:hypothetical protein